MAVAKFLAAALLLLVSLGAGAAAFPKFDGLEEELKLRPEQKIQFDRTIAATQRALLSVAMSALLVKDRLVAELAKPLPDLEVLAKAHESALEQSRPLFKEAGEEWKRLFDLLDERQLAIARGYLREHFDKLFAQIEAARR